MISVHHEVNRNHVCLQKNKENLHICAEKYLWEEISDGRLYN